MAELLDTASVRRIMETETEEHAEVDRPHIGIICMNGLSIIIPLTGLLSLGAKEIFTGHLHHRLLTFIRKRNYSFYLSKMELTSTSCLKFSDLIIIGMY